MRIPYVDIPGQLAPLKAELLAAIGDVIDSGQFVLGDRVEEFEQRFADLCGVRYAVGVNSGTDAIILALKALGIGSGDEVITAPNSFVATTSAVRLVGATPVFIDVGDDYNMDPGRIEQAISPRTRAILPVHLTGRPCAMDAICEIAGIHGLHVVEDCAQAVLAEYGGRRVGSFGAAGCYSLHPLKTLSACGDGGVVVTDDAGTHDRLRLLRNLGLQSRDDCVCWTHNSRLDNLQAAILLVKMQYLEAWTSKRRAHADHYRRRLRGLAGVRVPVDRETEQSVYHTFVIQVDHGRDELAKFLAARGIGTAVHYPRPIHLQTVAKDLGYGEGSFPVAERQAAHILSLPVYPELTESELDAVAQGVREFLQR